MYEREIEYLSSPLKIRLLWNAMADGFFDCELLPAGAGVKFTSRLDGSDRL